MRLDVTRRSFLVSSLLPALTLRAGPKESVQLLKTPNGGLQPQAMMDSKGVLHVVYLYGDPAAADVGYVSKRPGDSGFSDSIRVNDRPGSAIAIGTVRGVHLALGENGRVHVAWNGSAQAGPKGPNNASPMLYSRLNDAGNAFEPQRNVMTTATGLDGGGTVAADNFGNVYVTWHARGQKDGQALEGEGHRRVWLARSTDGGKTFEPETPVSPENLGACGCCGMGALADSHGNLYLLFRTAREIVHRDMYLLLSRDHGKTFRPVDLSPWEIGACPMSTVSLASGKDRVLLSWEKQGQIYFTTANQFSGSVGQIMPVPGQGKNRKHPSITTNARGEILLAWTEGTGWKKGGSLNWQLFSKTAQPVSSPPEYASVPAWGSPAAISRGDRFVVVC
jgi:hypothetical protein